MITCPIQKTKQGNPIYRIEVDFTFFPYEEYKSKYLISLSK